MSIAPADLLAWAQQNATQPETGARATVSRAYYAAYHHLKAWHAALPALGSVGGGSGGGFHKELIDQLTNPQVKDPQKQRTSKSLGYMLKDLRSMREEADYELQLHVDAQKAVDACAKAAKIFQLGVP
jgi:hypothetical protein